MIEVHHLNNSRSQRVLWMLEEIGAEYRVVRYERDAKTMLAPPELKQVHPLGRSPVIRDGDFVLAESGAILEYLVERYGSGRFVPQRGTREYETCRYWMHYAEGSLMMQLLVKVYLDRVGEPAKALHRLGLESRIRLTIPHFAVLPAILAKSDLAAIVPLRPAKRYAQSGGLAVLTPDLGLPPFTVAIHWVWRVHHDRGHQWLRTLIRNVLGGGR